MKLYKNQFKNFKKKKIFSFEKLYLYFMKDKIRKFHQPFLL